MFSFEDNSKVYKSEESKGSEGAIGLTKSQMINGAFQLQDRSKNMMFKQQEQTKEATLLEIHKN